VEGVRAATGGDGVDIVLNSLADEFVGASFDLLDHGGRFVELGKRGIMSPAEAAQRRPDVAYHVVDLAAGAEEDAAAVGTLLRSVAAELERGAIRPLSTQLFERGDVVEAFRFMAQARHIGKVVVAEELVGRGASSFSTDGLRPDATYLITGGTGGLGLEVARWMVAEGARHVALLARSNRADAVSPAVESMRALGARVELFQADVSEATSLEAALSALRQAMPPLAGVIHAAGVLRDGVLANQSWERFEQVLAPKVQGAWNLHRLTAGDALDFFVLFSSISGVMGSAGQANHAAANAFLDTLAVARRAAGLPAQSIDWGVWSRVGAAAAHGVGDRVEGRGMGSMTPEEGVMALKLAMLDDRPVGAIMPVDWDRFLEDADDRMRASFYSDLTTATHRSEPVTAEPDERSLLEGIVDLSEPKRLAALTAWVRERARDVLGLASVEAVPTDQPLSELGLDSLMAVELRNIIRTGLELGPSLPSTVVFDYPTVEALAGHLAADVLGWGEPGPEAPLPEKAPEYDPVAALARLESLSDDEVAARLRGGMKEDS
jgi:NAD(P)-dependent dehydrogenase (short-subunit alcohol dehydrogenase family)